MKMNSVLTVGVMGAMREEISPILEGLGKIKEHVIGNNTYYETDSIGENGRIKVFIAYSKIGKVHASITAAVLINVFNCQKIIFSGVAGALRDDLQVGDLVLATKLCQHDVDISAFGHPLGFIPESSLYVETDYKLNHLAIQIAQNNNINLKQGVIASGDQFIHDVKKRRFLSKQFNADLVEMEGAAVAVVCQNLNIPFCIFRSVSDNADGNADMSFDQFLIISSKKSAQFIKLILHSLSRLQAS